MHASCGSPLGQRPLVRCAAVAIALIAVVVTVGLLDPQVLRIDDPYSYSRGDPIIALAFRTPSWFQPAVGQIVLRSVTGSASESSILSIDRVVATSGQHIRVSRGEVSVDGQLAPVGHQPLGSIPPDVDIDCRMSSGQVAILPTLVRWHPSGPDPDKAIRAAITRASIVAEGDIVGRAVMIRRGWSRRGRPP